jgi:hypothetical protein
MALQAVAQLRLPEGLRTRPERSGGTQRSVAGLPGRETLPIREDHMKLRLLGFVSILTALLETAGAGWRG